MDHRVVESSTGPSTVIVRNSHSVASFQLKVVAKKSRLKRAVVDPCVFDLLLPSIIACGHGLEAISCFFDMDSGRLLKEVVRLDLPTPGDRPYRVSKRADAWSSAQIQDLMLLWPTNLFASCIGERIGRSAGSVRYKAKWLGLPVRVRRQLRRFSPSDPAAPTVLPLIPARKARKVRGKVVKTSLAEDKLIGEHHLTGVHSRFTAQAIVRGLRDIERRKSSLQLPPRHFMRGKLKMEYDPDSPHLEPFLHQGWVFRQCLSKMNWFWGTKDGPRISNATKRSKWYKDRMAGLDESSSNGREGGW